MFLFIVKILTTLFFLYTLLVSTNFAILWIDNKVNIANGQSGYNSTEAILRLAFAKSHNQLKNISFWSKKGINKYIEYQHNQLQIKHYNTALNAIVNELIYRFENDTNFKLTNQIWYNGWYLYIPITKQTRGNELSDVESYLQGVVSKYSLDFAVDSVTCQNLQNIGWCFVVQLNYSELAKFNRIARQQEVSKPDDFHDEDEVF
ncbi:hypothetical protein RG608_10855 [Streptococcus sp. IsoGale022]|uniref:hypothetical protein n=1 Tax=Streptococcus sp. IsoGale022 TaxID=2923524 RepID=UPI00280EF98A|nr:hypothetical protein [Streptococcus sp. IsoGale022]MDQ8693607.1 hypothetical protein [Streptococcus sp. IsoGale022]